MIIAIPVDETDMRGKVSSSFGRAPYFLIYEVETKTATFVENSALANPGGAGIKAAQIMVDHQVTALLTPRCGKNAAEVLETAGIKMFRTTALSMEDHIDAFLSEKLAPLEEVHAGVHGHGGD